jgi:peptide deformylase
MSLLKVARMGHPILRKKAAALTAKELASADIQDLIDDLVETMREYDGVGLAAPQVHASKQIVVYEVSAEGKDRVPLTLLVNPQILPESTEQAEDWEGCLSIPGLRGRVPRYASIRVRALDRKGKALEFAARGFHARVIQHETDHLLGILYPDRMRGLESLSFLDEYTKYGSTGAKA